jgi:hypothetical protein
MDEHFFRELAQIQLIQKKLIQKLETSRDSPTSDIIMEAIDDLDHLNGFTTSLTKTLSTKKTK